MEHGTANTMTRICTDQGIDAHALDKIRARPDALHDHHVRLQIIIDLHMHHYRSLFIAESDHVVVGDAKVRAGA